jgi:UDP-N-acetylmuramyl pentapeptide phosphotransferase/UDP-N-acetylglucosamine-1-phosphate transferase
MQFIFFTAALFGIELAYFSVARAYQIIDKPNHRSLHEKPTIRGGGIIFPLALFLFYSLTGDVSYYLVIALAMVTMVGLLDDIKGLNHLARLTVQVMAMLIVFYELNVFAHMWWIIILLLFIATGTVNAYNFMDGINGITCGYSLVVLASLYYINSFVTPFVNHDLLLVIILALLVFGFFNFRTRAVCFAGDVGSLTIGFVLIYLILKLTMVSHNYVYILFLAVYGTDSVLTVIHRLILKQNIVTAHRLHLYQVVISSTGMAHLPMTFIYMAAQAVVSLLIIYNLDESLKQQYLSGMVILISLSVIYIAVKRKFHKQQRNGL